jgi:hypothetical protein
MIVFFKEEFLLNSISDYLMFQEAQAVNYTVSK